MPHPAFENSFPTVLTNSAPPDAALLLLPSFAFFFTRKEVFFFSVLFLLTFFEATHDIHENDCDKMF